MAVVVGADVGGSLAMARVVLESFTPTMAVEILMKLDGLRRRSEEESPRGSQSVGGRTVVGQMGDPSLDQTSDFWIATIVPDEGAAPKQMIDAVVRARRLLPASAIGIFPPSARPHDWVCFFVSGAGVLGCGRLGARIEPAGAPVRGAHRFAAIFALTESILYDESVPLDPRSLQQRLATRTPVGVAGSFLSPISEQDFLTLTAVQLAIARS